MTPEELAKLEKQRSLDPKTIENEIVTRIKSIEAAIESVPEKHAKAFEKKLDDILKDKVDALVKEILEQNRGKIREDARRKIIWDGKDARYAETGEKTFSLVKLFAAISKNDWGNAKFEQDIVEKAMSEGTDTAGGFLVPEEYLLDIKERITARAVLRQLGMTTYPMKTDTLNIPRITGGGTAAWLGENAAGTPANATLAQLQLVAKKLMALIEVSNELIRDSNPRVEEVLRRDTAKVMALKEDIDFIRGTGTPPVPKGIINHSGINEVTLGANGGTPSFDTIYDALYQVELNNGIANGFVFHPRTKNTLRKLKDSNNRYIYNVNPSVKEPDTLVGLPALPTTQLPVNLTVGTSTDCSEIITGQFDEAIVGERDFMEFALDGSGKYFEKYQTAIRAIQREDFGLRTENVFTKVTGVRP